MSDQFIKFEIDLLKQLSARQCVLLAVIQSMALKRGYAYAQNNTFAQLLNCSVDIIQRDLNELEAKEFIQRRLIKSEKNNSTQRMIYPHRKNVVPPTVEMQHPHHKNATTPTADLRYPPPQNCGVDTNKEILQDNTKNDTIELGLNLWLKHNEQMGKKLTAISIQMIRDEVITKFGSPERFLHCVKESIKNNYRTIINIYDSPTGSLKYGTLD